MLRGRNKGLMSLEGGGKEYYHVHPLLGRAILEVRATENSNSEECLARVGTSGATKASRHRECQENN